MLKMILNFLLFHGGALALAIFPKSMIRDPLIGGIARYKPVRHDLFFMDIVSAMADRLEKMGIICGTCGSVSFQADVSAVQALLRQAERVYIMKVLKKAT